MILLPGDNAQGTDRIGSADIRNSGQTGSQFAKIHNRLASGAWVMITQDLLPIPTLTRKGCALGKDQLPVESFLI
jgi:hypothetical protein